MEIKSYSSSHRNSKLDHDFYDCTLIRSADIENLDQIITDLSKNNTVKKLALDFYWNCYPKDSLPSSFYSLDQLTDLYLRNCDLYPIPKVKERLRCLKNLTVDNPSSGKSLVHLLSVCPVLKNFTLICPADLHSSSYYMRDGPISIFKMCNNLSKIEHMSLCTFGFEAFKKEAPPVHPRKLVHLKYLCLHSILTNNLHSILLLIRILPNLEKLKLQMVSGGTVSATQPDYPDIRLEHLRELEVINCGDNKYHSDFVRFILAKSPVLKEVSIAFHSRVFVRSVEGIETMRILVKSPCASPVAEINFKHPKYDLSGFKSLYLSGRPPIRNQF